LAIRAAVRRPRERPSQRYRIAQNDSRSVKAPALQPGALDAAFWEFNLPALRTINQTGRAATSIGAPPAGGRSARVDLRVFARGQALSPRKEKRDNALRRKAPSTS
jgi:hypothetical protein